MASRIVINKRDRPVVVIAGRAVGKTETLTQCSGLESSRTPTGSCAHRLSNARGRAHHHAGNIGRPDVIAGLRRIEPVIAIRGNVDIGHWAEHYPDADGKARWVLHLRPARHP